MFCLYQEIASRFTTNRPEFAWSLLKYSAQNINHANICESQKSYISKPFFQKGIPATQRLETWPSTKLGVSNSKANVSTTKRYGVLTFYYIVRSFKLCIKSAHISMVWFCLSSNRIELSKLFSGQKSYTRISFQSWLSMRTVITVGHRRPVNAVTRLRWPTLMVVNQSCIR